MNWKANDWLEHPSFGIGRVSEDRGDRIDIRFINSGAKIILKSTQLKRIQSTPDLKFPGDNLKSRTPRLKTPSATYE